jgi:alkylation response protein AidB-like acyl-CoA dehydrogenase
MRDEFLPHQSQFRLQVRSFVQQRLLPLSENWERSGRFPLSILQQCAQHKLICLDPERNAVVAEELPKCESLGFALTVFVQANLIAPLLNQLASAQQKKKLLDPLVAGKLLGAMAVSEPAAGSDFAALQTQAVRTRNGWRLTGVKSYITNAAIANVIIVAAQTDPDEGLQGLTLFLVPVGTPGVVVKPLPMLGLTTSAAGEVIFEDCEVPSTSMLGERRQAFSYIQAGLNRERLFGGLACVRWAQHALDKSRLYVRQRKAFGQRLSQFQSLRHQIAEMETRLEAARQLNYSVFRRWLLQDEVTKEICMIKLFSYQVAQEVITGCLQLHGGLGYTEEHWCSRFYRDARALTIAAGTPEIMKEMIAAYLRV